MAEREQIRKSAPAKADEEVVETPGASESGEKLKAELDDLLDEMDMGPEDVLLGLYQGTPLTERRWDHGNALPDRITLFQRSIEEDCESEDEVVVAIGETLIHELGHYFGMSEEEIMEIEERYWRGEGS